MKFVVFFNHLLNPGLSGLHTQVGSNIDTEDAYQRDKTANDEVIFCGSSMECLDYLMTLPTDDQPNEIEIAPSSYRHPTRQELINDILNDTAVSYQELHPYLNSIKTYLCNYWSTSGIYFVCTFLTNAIQSGYVCAAEEVSEVISIRSSEAAQLSDDPDMGYEYLEELYSFQTSKL